MLLFQEATGDRKKGTEAKIREEERAKERDVPQYQVRVVNDDDSDGSVLRRGQKSAMYRSTK